MFNFVRKHLVTFVTIGVTLAVGLVLGGGDLTQIAEAGRTG